jgi:hypothetical protein
MGIRTTAGVVSLVVLAGLTAGAATPQAAPLGAAPACPIFPADNVWNEDVSALTKAIRKGDGDALFEHFVRTRAIRKGIVDIGQDSPAPDFGRPHPDLPHGPMPKPYASGEG